MGESDKVREARRMLAEAEEMVGQALTVRRAARLHLEEALREAGGNEATVRELRPNDEGGGDV